jgi:hypothetical protein
VASTPSNAILSDLQGLDKHSELDLAGPADQTFERLPNGEFGWLRARPVRVLAELSAPLPPNARFELTDLGRRALRMADLFDPRPTA